MSLVSSFENSITYEDELILFNGRLLIERYPERERESISLSDGSLIKLDSKKGKFSILKKGDAILSANTLVEKVLIDPDKVNWVVFGELEWV